MAFVQSNGEPDTGKTCPICDTHSPDPELRADRSATASAFYWRCIGCGSWHLIPREPNQPEAVPTTSWETWIDELKEQKIE